MKTTTEMQLVPITKLVPYVNNARTHSPEQINKLRSSLREFGFINPVIIDRDYGVIAGHGRILAAKEEGISEVPCVLSLIHIQMCIRDRNINVGPRWTGYGITSAAAVLSGSTLRLLPTIRTARRTRRLSIPRGRISVSYTHL